MSYRPYSYSRVATYMRCPQRFKFKYVDKLPEIAKDAGRLGSAVHEAIRSYITSGEGEIPLTVVPPEAYDFALEMFENAKSILPELGEVVATEMRFAVTKEGLPTDFDSQDAFYRGIIDLVTFKDGKLFVWDWKTGVADPEVLQLLLYMHYLPFFFDGEVGGGGFVFLRSANIKHVEYDAGITEKAVSDFMKVIEQIEKDTKFAPRPGDHCAFCSYVALCPLVKRIEAQDIPAIRNEEEAKAVYEQIQALREKLKRYQRFLDEFVKEAGYLDLGDKVLIPEFQVYYRVSDKEGFERELKAFLGEEGALEYVNYKLADLAKLDRFKPFISEHQRVQIVTKKREEEVEE